MNDELSLDTLCGGLSYAMGITPPQHAAAPAQDLVAYIDEKLGGEKADRILMYNPDAIGKWLWTKYPQYLADVEDKTELDLSFWSPMPPVTPVCFGTMYTGAQPEVHGIQKYEKPVITIDTFFDALIRAGKKPLIIAVQNCSLSKIFLERDMDYIITSGSAETNAYAAEAILEDKHDFILVYNGNYDSKMHRVGCEDPEALAELRYNGYSYATLANLVERHWGHHNTLMGFAMDHGSHTCDPFIKNGKLYQGTHGKDQDADRYIRHRYRIYPRTK